MINCIYHSRDLDGWSSAAIVMHKYGADNVNLIPFDHGDTFNHTLMVSGTDTIMVDIILPMADMRRLGEFTYIDHHKSAITEMMASDLRGIMVMDTSLAACELTWEYIFPKEKMPKAIRLLGIYDSWREEEDKEYWETTVTPFQYAMKNCVTSPEDFPSALVFGTDLSDQYVNDKIYQGQTIMQYQDGQNKKLCEMLAFEHEFDGYKAICLNSSQFGSRTFKSVWDPEKYDIMILFFYNGKFWTHSIYSTKEKIDCSKIAVAHGGGGHKGAAGFQMENANFLSNP